MADARRRSLLPVLLAGGVGLVGGSLAVGPETSLLVTALLVMGTGLLLLAGLAALLGPQSSERQSEDDAGVHDARE